MKRPCLDCPTIGEWKRGRCPEHERTRDRARGTKTQRGYAAAIVTSPLGTMSYDATRAAYARRMAAGEAYWCSRTDCKTPDEPIDPTSFDLGHNDLDRSIIDGPQHPTCNRATSTHRMNMQPTA